MCQMEVLRLLVGDCPTINHDVAPPCSGLPGEEHGWLEKVTQGKGKACIHERKRKEGGQRPPGKVPVTRAPRRRPGKDKSEMGDGNSPMLTNSDLLLKVADLNMQPWKPEAVSMLKQADSGTCCKWL